jgi:hypothetical protein
MLKSHCDNCDAVIDQNAGTFRRVSVQPGGFQCTVSVKISKEGATSTEKELCAVCLRSAVQEFLASIHVRPE